MDDVIQEKFQQFHKDNPHIYDLILKAIADVKKAGFNSYSINGIFERIRWHHHIVRGKEPFKLNNNYRSRYVRLIEKEHPEYRDFFEKRALVAGA